jgi:hypothetical protein
MTFAPDRSNIIGISQSNPAVVTTSPDHGLSTGAVVRLVVPRNFGMYELNALAVQAIVLSSSTFSCYYTLVPTAISVNTSSFTPFVIPSNPGMLASILPMGQGPTPQTTLEWQAQSGYCESLIEDAVFNDSTTEIPF